MSVTIDKIGVTFQGEEELLISRKFREILKHQGISINAALKIIIKKYVKDFVK